MGDEIKADIVFADNTVWHVRSTAEEIKAAIEDMKRMALPLIKIVNHDGDEVWVNANHIRAFKTHDPSMPSVAFGS